MSNKKQTLKKFDTEFYSDDWPYSDVYTPEQDFNHLGFCEEFDLHLPCIKSEDLYTQIKVEKEIILVEKTANSRRSNILSFIGGVVCTCFVLALVFVMNRPPQDRVPEDALVLLRELNTQFEIQSAVDEIKANTENPYKMLDGPEFIEKLRVSDAHADKQIWLEASRRRDERVTIALLELLEAGPERTQVQALLALSSGFHAEQSVVFRRMVSGIQNDFSPFVRAYASKVILHTYGMRAEKFLQSRMLVEKDSFVLAITTRMLQSMRQDSKLAAGKKL